MTEGVKRPYRSTRRAGAAAARREAIRHAAGALFVEQGYTATTMRQVADRAGVGERTLYDAFPTKATLFGHVAGVAIVGDEEPVAVADRPEFVAALEEADGPTAVGLYARYSTELLERAGPLIMVAVESAGADPAMRRFSDEGARATRSNSRAFVRSLAHHGVLRPDVDVDTGAGAAFALGSPHVHQLLRTHSRWSAARYRAWLGASLADALLPRT